MKQCIPFIHILMMYTKYWAVDQHCKKGTVNLSRYESQTSPCSDSSDVIMLNRYLNGFLLYSNGYKKAEIFHTMPTGKCNVNVSGLLSGWLMWNNNVRISFLFSAFIYKWLSAVCSVNGCVARCIIKYIFKKLAGSRTWKSMISKHVVHFIQQIVDDHVFI